MTLESQPKLKSSLRLPENPAIEAYKNPDKWSHLLEASINFTPERKLIVEALMERAWFQRTSPELQLELAKLADKNAEMPEGNHDGFLADLAGRPDVINDLEVIKLEKLPRGNFALIPTFKVKNKAGNEYPYEYISWRHGPNSGAKGLAFVKNHGAITHLIVLRGGKFATGKSEFDTIGGFINPEDTQEITAAIKKTAYRELTEELGLPDLKVEKIFDLGKIRVDAGMTNNNPSLFAAIIDGEEAKKISPTPLNPDKFELKAGVLIVPIGQLPELMKTNQDGLFLSTVAKSAAYGIIRFDQLHDKNI